MISRSENTTNTYFFGKCSHPQVSWIWNKTNKKVHNHCKNQHAKYVHPQQKIKLGWDSNPPSQYTYCMMGGSLLPLCNLILMSLYKSLFWGHHNYPFWKFWKVNITVNSYSSLRSFHSFHTKHVHLSYPFLTTYTMPYLNNNKPNSMHLPKLNVTEIKLLQILSIVTVYW